MNRRKYDRSVVSELTRLAGLALRREADERMKEISSVTGRWKNGSLDPAESVREIRRISGISVLARMEGADPGEFAARAVSSGLLCRDDFTDAAWNAIEILVTLAEI